MSEMRPAELCDVSVSKSLTVSEAVESRRSVREFDPDYAVPLETLQELLTKAMQTPSGGNLQPWKMYVLGGDKRDELVERVGEKMQGLMQGGKREKSRYRIYPKDLEKKVSSTPSHVLCITSTAPLSQPRQPPSLKLALSARTTHFTRQPG